MSPSAKFTRYRTLAHSSYHKPRARRTWHSTSRRSSTRRAPSACRATICCRAAPWCKSRDTAAPSVPVCVSVHSTYVSLSRYRSVIETIETLILVLLQSIYSTRSRAYRFNLYIIESHCRPTRHKLTGDASSLTRPTFVIVSTVTVYGVCGRRVWPLTTVHFMILAIVVYE